MDELYDDVLYDYEDAYDFVISEELSSYTEKEEVEEEEEEEEEVVAGEYDSIQAYFDSDEGIEFASTQSEYLMDLYGEYYSAIGFYAEDNTVTYEYTYIEEQDASAFEDLLSVEDFEADFEDWTTRTGVEEMSIQVIYLNPDGTVLYDETFSNF